LKKEDIPKITVNPKRFEKIIQNCEVAHQNKKTLRTQFESCVIRTHPPLYEEFFKNKIQYFQIVFELLVHSISREEIETAIDKGAYFQKVHSVDIAEFVINHQEVIDRFGDRYIEWRWIRNLREGIR